MLSVPDELPDDAQVEAGFGTDPAPALRAIALGMDQADTSQRLRAIALLSSDPTDESRTVLRSIINNQQAAVTGTSLIGWIDW